MAIPIEDDEERNLYQILELTNEASEDEIKRAYRKLALRHHPDKLAAQKLDDKAIQEATRRFQAIGYAYSILSNAGLKARYDKTGSVEGLEHGLNHDNDDFDWTEYFKTLWTGEVSAKTIREYEKKYKGSKEEKEDLYQAYEAGKGSIDHILESVPCSTVDDEARFVGLINEGIEAKEVSKFPGWAQNANDSKARKRRRHAAAKEAVEAEAYAKELGLNDLIKDTDKRSKRGTEEDTSGLELLIRQRAQAREARADEFFDNLAEKYKPKKKSKKASQ